MADVTFGVKVPEEMKNELAEIMKSTQLTGKEFMGLLLTTYKLEQKKQAEDLLVKDIDELQRLLQRIQTMYLNVSERVGLIVEERIGEVEAVVVQKEEEKEALIKEKSLLEEKINNLLKEKEEAKDRYVALEKAYSELEEQISEQKIQIKQHHTLCEKYEEQIVGLKEENSKWERLEIEIKERNEENERLKVRNDEVSSELWFAQREVEKLKELLKQEEDGKNKELTTLKEKYDLELQNSLLEQKLVFTNKIEVLKEEQHKVQQELNDRIQNLLLGIKMENK
ncbi:MAG: hypothetical protein ACLSH8_16185 [Zhenhengia sp.]|jgi:chromosome segregation ATPase|uniref:hypothetical protein n=1 Tax=Zhenhengia sp. TaxID=2944208 RepID=UPI002906FC6F|nr:hypothetical protein [Clostridiales bacterium]MDU6855697.1 hypothetical protein [Clostridiales bacterium]MDU6975592.1 hypothetical protein [Clostridiales bacterium]